MITGLALLAFLGDGSTMRSGPHEQQVRRAVIWLKDQQIPDGQIGDPAAVYAVYDHAIATLAMTEAYGLSSYRVLKRYAVKALGWLQKAQNDDGGWGLQSQDGRSLTPPTAWAAMAFRTAGHFRLLENEDAAKKANAWLVSAGNGQDGTYALTLDPDERARAAEFPFGTSPGAVTAMGAWTRIMLGYSPRSYPSLRTSGDQILKRPPRWAEAEIDVAYWYNGSHLMFQLGGVHWKMWQRHLRAALLENQSTEQHSAGSWAPLGLEGREGGRVYATALGVLTLEVYYRYSRLIR